MNQSQQPVSCRPVKRAEDDVSMTSTRWRMSTSRAYELSPDLREKQVEMLCRKYGGPALASHAARVIQHAYRRYRLSRSFARMRLEAAASPRTTHSDQRLSRSLADVDAAIETAGPPHPRVVTGICCRVRTDLHRHVDAVRWTGTDRRRVVAVHKSNSVSVTSTTTSSRHHERVVVRPGCCVSPDTTSVASSDAGPGRGPTHPATGVVVDRHERRALPVTTSIVPPAVDGSRSDDELLSGVVVSRTTANCDDVDELTDDEVQLGDEDQPTTTSTFHQLCLTDSSYGEMTAAEPHSDTDETQPHYGEVVVVPRTHVYSSLRLCNSKHSTMTVASQSSDEVTAAFDSPIWKRQDVGSGDVTVRCVGCGWRGQSAPQLNDDPAVMTAASSASMSTGSLAAIGNNCLSVQLIS